MECFIILDTKHFFSSELSPPLASFPLVTAHQEEQKINPASFYLLAQMRSGGGGVGRVEDGGAGASRCDCRCRIVFGDVL